jgi:hypothetical protein
MTEIVAEITKLKPLMMHYEYIVKCRRNVSTFVLNALFLPDYKLYLSSNKLYHAS